MFSNFDLIPCNAHLHVSGRISMAGRKSLPKKTGAVLGTAALAMAACGPAHAGAVEFSCSVSGGKAIGSAKDICAAFQQKIDGTLNHATRPAGSFDAGGQGDAIAVDIQILQRGSVVANVKQRKSGAVRDLPEISVDVMDRPMGMRDVVMLAGEVARLLGEETT
jgi:hypothetical protein